MVSSASGGRRLVAWFSNIFISARNLPLSQPLHLESLRILVKQLNWQSHGVFSTVIDLEGRDQRLPGQGMFTLFIIEIFLVTPAAKMTCTSTMKYLGRAGKGIASIDTCYAVAAYKFGP